MATRLVRLDQHVLLAVPTDRFWEPHRRRLFKVPRKSRQIVRLDSQIKLRRHELGKLVHAAMMMREGDILTTAWLTSLATTAN